MRFSCFGKVLATAGFSVFMAFGGQAQGVYTKVGGGYNLGLNGLRGTNLTVTRTGIPQNGTQQTVEEAERVNINYGKGFSGSGALGYMFNKQVGAEVEVGYLKGGNNETLYRFYSQNSTFGFDSSTTRTNTYARMLLLQPSLVISTDLSEKVDLYGKFGMIVSRGRIFSVSDIKSGQSEYTETRYDGGWGWGLQAALGLAINFSEKYAFYSELKMSNLSYSPTNLHLEEKIRNGEDVTEAEPRDTPLEDSYTNMNGQTNVLLKPNLPFSYVGLHIGLKYSF